jgi:hypothetical protein
VVSRQTRSNSKSFSAVAALIAGTVDRTLPDHSVIARSVAHSVHAKSEIWDNNQDILRMLVVDVTPFQQSYVSIRSLRANYDVVCDHVVDYENAVRGLHATARK